MTSLLLLTAALACQEPVSPAAAPLVIPFDILASRHMAVQVLVNGKGPYRLIFDTGAPFSLVSNRISREAELTKKPKQGDKKAPAEAAPFGMASLGGMLKIDEVQLGDVKVRKLPVMVLDHPTVKALAVAVGDLDGIIGFPFFARYRTTIDYEKRQMHLTPVDYDPGDVLASMMKTMMAPRNKAPVKQVGARTLWGFEAKKEADDEAAGVTVVRVWNGGPAAEAGLLPGDRLLILDGHWTDSLEDCLRAAAGVKPGRAAEARIQREGKEIRLSLRPRLGV